MRLIALSPPSFHSPAGILRRMNTDTDTDTDIYTMYIPADTINIVSFEPYT